MCVYIVCVPVCLQCANSFQEYKEDGNKPGMNREEALQLGLKVLSKTMDSTTLTPEKLELALLTRDEASGAVR